MTKPQNNGRSNFCFRKKATKRFFSRRNPGAAPKFDPSAPRQSAFCSWRTRIVGDSETNHEKTKITRSKVRGTVLLEMTRWPQISARARVARLRAVPAETSEVLGEPPPCPGPFSGPRPKTCRATAGGWWRWARRGRCPATCPSPTAWLRRRRRIGSAPSKQCARARRGNCPSKWAPCTIGCTSETALLRTKSVRNCRLAIFYLPQSKIAVVIPCFCCGLVFFFLNISIVSWIFLFAIIFYEHAHSIWPPILSLVCVAWKSNFRWNAGH